MKFDVLNRWSGKVQFTAEIDCDESLSPSLKLGLAVRWAYKSGAVLSDADLRGAVLRDADLRGAVLSDADLRGAVLSDADLRGAVLSDADLRTFKADLWMTLSENAKEVPAMLDALREGRVNGSTYSGQCACLVGTIANIRGVDVETLPRNATNPAEQWFLMIGEGDTPDKDTGGGFAAKAALVWGEEWCALHGVAVTAKI